MSVKQALRDFEAGPTRLPQERRRAVAYIRASTEEQQLGPEAQEQQIRSYATRTGVELVAVYRDLGISGGAPLDERPGLGEALEGISKLEADVLIVAKRDRFGRDSMRCAFVEHLIEKAGARVETADGVAGGVSPEDKLLRQIMDALAEYERAAIRMRTKAALAAKRRRGEIVGQLPYGWMAVEQKLAESPTEQAAITAIVTMRDAGMTWAEVTDAMQSRHPQAARGARWHPTSCKRAYTAAKARGR